MSKRTVRPMTVVPGRRSGSRRLLRERPSLNCHLDIVSFSSHRGFRTGRRGDEAIYSANGLLSGHTLKYLAAAAACFAILRYFQTRRPIFEAEPGRLIPIARMDRS